MVVAWLPILPVTGQEQTSLPAAALVLTIAGVASFPTVHWLIAVVVLGPSVRWLIATVEIDPAVRWLIAIVELDSLVS